MARLDEKQSNSFDTIMMFFTIAPFIFFLGPIGIGNMHAWSNYIFNWDQEK